MLDQEPTPTPASTSTAATADAGGPGKTTLAGVLQRSGAGNGASASNQQIAAAGFSGAPMALPYQGEMESSFGRSFSGVQAYGGGVAAEANQALGSQAYAVGQQVAFADASPSKAMVAHELAHTVQQSGGAGPVQTWAEGSPGDSFEQEADAAAASVLAGEKPTISLSTGPSIHRWGGSDHYTIGNLAGQKAVQAARAVGINDFATFQVDPNHGGVMHGDTAGQPGATPSQSGTADPRRLAAQHAGGMGGTSTGIHTGDNNETLGVRTSQGTLSFGAASRYGGDYSTTVDNPGMSGMAFPGLNQRGTELSGAGGGGSASTIQFAQMTIGGMTNSNHFFPLNQMEYQTHHRAAIGHAQQAAALKNAGDQAGFSAAMDQALREEGFANHFLQDTFSSGHMAPRSLDSCEALHGDRSTTATALNNAATGATQAVSSTASDVGSGVGTVTGAVSGFFHRVGNLQNPFSAEGRAEIRQAIQEHAQATSQSFGGAADSVMQTITSPIRTGGVVNQAAAAADHASAFYNNALMGLERSKQWHDYFCALPNGLPTTRGNFHGDYFMDGNDLEVVSETAANSICDVIQTAHGQSFHATNVDIPSPNFSAIMADPMAGPVWRLMMQDYQASLRQAQQQLQPGDHGTTDGGTQYDSATVLRMIQESTFGGAEGANLQTPEQHQQQLVTQAGADPTGALHTGFTELRGVIMDIEHYCSTEFGYNQNLGPAGAHGPGGGHGLDDNLNQPDASTDLGSGATGHAFDVCQLEGQFGLFTSLIEKATSYKAVLSTASSNPQFSQPQQQSIDAQIILCDAMIGLATTWKQRVNDFISSSMTIPVAHNGGSGYDADPNNPTHRHRPDEDWSSGQVMAAQAGTVGVLGLAGAVAGSHWGPLGTVLGGAVGLRAGLGLERTLSGPEGNRVAWGAGHPEWISNSAGRNSFREHEVLPNVQNWFNQTTSEPDFHIQAASPPSVASAGR